MSTNDQTMEELMWGINGDIWKCKTEDCHKACDSHPCIKELGMRMAAGASKSPLHMLRITCGEHGMDYDVETVKGMAKTEDFEEFIRR